MTSPSRPQSNLRQLLLTVTVMVGTLMQTLDGTIANIALPHMQAALGATPESIAWVLTSYMIMAAIATPISGWLECQFGRRRILTISVVLFTLSSAVCGAALSLELMVLARAVQGIFGAFILPIGMATLVDSSPPEKRAKVMMIWVTGVMIGPIFGPVIGGWLIDVLNWRWIFYINLPFGILASLGTWLLVAEPKLERRPFDLFGFGFLALALGALQLMLDRGSHLDWFESTEILIECAIAIASMWVFVIHTFTTGHPLIPLTLFRDRNLMISSFFVFICAGVLYGGAALVAPMMQHLMGYDTLTAGLTMLPRGVSTLTAMLLAGRLGKFIPARTLVATGMLITGAGLLLMCDFSLQMGQAPILWSGIIQGFGIGLIMMPLQLMAFDTLAPALRTEGAAFFSISRGLGGSISIAILGALLARNLQISHSDMSGMLTATTAPYLDPGVSHAFGLSGNLVAAMIDAEISRQAMMIAYLDDYWLMTWAIFLGLPMVLLLQKGSKDAAPEEPGQAAILYD